MSQQKISKHKVVTITYSILDEDGVVKEQSDNPVAYVHGGPNQMFEQIQESLEGCTVGDSIDVTLLPEQAFGLHNPELAFTDDITNVPEQFRYVGAEVEMQNENGETRTFFVSRIEDGEVTVDCNHPFAGKTVTFAIRVSDIRDGTEEEIKKSLSHEPVLH